MGSPAKTLKEKMAALAKENAPSMNPVHWPPTPEEKAEEERPPDISELGLTLAVRSELSRLVKEHYALGVQKSQFGKDQKPLITSIKKILEANTLDKFRVGDIPVTYYSSERKTLSVTKLMAHGVDIETIKDCYEIKTASTLRIGGSQRGEEE